METQCCRQNSACQGLWCLHGHRGRRVARVPEATRRCRNSPSQSQGALTADAADTHTAVPEQTNGVGGGGNDKPAVTSAGRSADRVHVVPLRPCIAPQPSHGGCPEGPVPLSCLCAAGDQVHSIEDAFPIGPTWGKLVSSSVSNHTKTANAWQCVAKRRWCGSPRRLPLLSTLKLLTPAGRV